MTLSAACRFALHEMSPCMPDPTWEVTQLTILYGAFLGSWIIVEMYAKSFANLMRLWMCFECRVSHASHPMYKAIYAVAKQLNETLAGYMECTIAM